MSAPQFTPPPWRIDGLTPQDGWGAYENEDTVEIACLPHDAFDALEIFGKRHDYYDFAEHEANARLIAAAPELYEALDALERYLRDTPHHNAPPAANARAVIRKARGEQ